MSVGGRGCTEPCIVHGWRSIKILYCTFDEALITVGARRGMNFSRLKFVILFEHLNFGPFVRLVLATVSLLKSVQTQNRQP